MDTTVQVGTAWHDIGPWDQVAPLSARCLRLHGEEFAVFRTGDDQVFVLRDQCPHKAGKLSQGIVHGTSVTCPLHGWVIDLASGAAQAPDEGAATRVAARLQDGRIFVALPG